MSTGTWILIVMAAATAGSDWVAVSRRPAARKLEYVAKPLTLVLLVGVALAVDPADEAQRAWFVAALVLCLAGDVFLMLPSEQFVAGLGSFLLGHLAYVVAFTLEDGFSGTGLTLGVVAVVATGVVLGRRVLVAVRLGPESALFVPVVAYMVVISAMVATAVGSGDPVAVVGAGLFYGSDLCIAVTRFERPRRWGPLTIMITYHLAQVLLVGSIVR